MTNKIIRVGFNKATLYCIYHPGDCGHTSQTLSHEITPQRIKASIYHELSHWVRDSLGNSFLTKLVTRASETHSPEIKNLGNPNVNMTTFELDAQIHGIKGIKQQNPDAYNNYTLLELFLEYTSLFSIYKTLYNRRDGSHKVWLTNLLKRMHRENLIGKNMKGSVDALNAAIIDD